ncbi:hypothetical protein PSECIP111951_02639 [Pseudoalteromonas holothuriae]|uniref:NAD(P)-binding domain-containing protein n=1 Tax=Pseudoalteromonas holothuriae TaxID=2963714 RepID=A0A9W4R2X0_9GAMM|nr:MULTISPECIES: NAD(P)-binding oxidoreductase [unclassified Pseudoalteromonas]CAH9062174.1 hypothetical protein PSECIP111951_02639 [Pseudoalteromonas sp. CIP111951]CAH9065699.1 hypothetical protein PSECIP111854_03736 [Pseudoalteromonas sp. CIP111854]
MTNKVLVLGASGATGKHVVTCLLKHDLKVVTIVRESSTLAPIYEHNDNYDEVRAQIDTLDIEVLAKLISQCNTVICCLGHNLSIQGIYGKPRKLVVNALMKVTSAISKLEKKAKTKVILMNTTGVRNRDIDEAPPLSQNLVIGLLRCTLPPQVDNELAADHLRVNIGQNHPYIEWVSVRPDALIDEQAVSQYDITASPTRNAIFDAAQTSRINVAKFMCELTLDERLWRKWEGQMPVIYNREL